MPGSRIQSPASLLLIALLAVPPALASDTDPAVWLQRMSAAVQTTNYEGTVLRIQDGKVEALKVVHTVSDGVIREKVVAQDGIGLEIIRNGNEVHCILPDRKTVLVEEWDDKSTLFSTLPSSEIRFGAEYDVSYVREDRVAGRKTIMIAIRPHDEYRYGHRIWLDMETGFPLQTQLIAGDGNAIEQVKFAEITLDAEIHASALAPSYSTDSFQWFDRPTRHESRSVETDWTSDNLPRGFQAVSLHEEQMPGNDEFVTHILYSDGLANVSVFIAESVEESTHGPSQFAGSNSFSAVSAGHSITAVGEVPAVTVEQIARSMRPR